MQWGKLLLISLNYWNGFFFGSFTSFLSEIVMEILVNREYHFIQIAFLI